jgi:hypothetical protein
MGKMFSDGIHLYVPEMVSGGSGGKFESFSNHHIETHSRQSTSLAEGAVLLREQ